MIFLELWYTTRNIFVVVHSSPSVNILRIAWIRTSVKWESHRWSVGVTEPWVIFSCPRLFKGKECRWMNIAWMNLLRAGKWKNSVGDKRKSVKEQTLHFPLSGTLTWVRMIRKVSWESSSQTGLGEKCSKKWIVPISKIILPINQSAV